MSVNESDPQSLTMILSKFGYTHCKSTTSANQYAHDVFCDGDVVFTGTAHAVWKWLSQMVAENAAVSEPSDKCGALSHHEALLEGVVFKPACTHLAHACDGVNHAHRIAYGSSGEAVWSWVELPSLERGSL